MIGRAVEWMVSAAYVVIVTFGLIWLLGLFGLDFQTSVLAYLLAWVMFWDRRHIAKVMRDADES